MYRLENRDALSGHTRGHIVEGFELLCKTHVYSAMPRDAVWRVYMWP